MRFYKSTQNRHKGTKETFFLDASSEAERSGLTVDNIVAAVTLNDAVSISSQSYNATTQELAYRVSFDHGGESTVTITTTFQGTDEAMVSKVRFRTMEERTVPTYGRYYYYG